MNLVNAIYGKDYTALRTTVWEKGFKGGYSDVPPEVIAWIDKAASEYYRRRIYALDQMDTLSSDALLKLWEDILTEMCSDDQTHKDAVYEAVLADDRVSAAAKSWLKKH